MISFWILLQEDYGQFSFLEREIEDLRNVMDLALAGISNGIATTNILIVFFSFLVMVAGISVSVYIARLRKKILKLRNEVEQKEEAVKKINDDIQSDIEGLYQRLRDEETLTILKRLERVPEDIGNLASNMLARELRDEWFPILKKAYKKLLENPDVANKQVYFYSTNKDLYLQQFFQHYVHLAIADDDIRDDLLQIADVYFDCAFKNDIEVSTERLCVALNQMKDTAINEDILFRYLKAINESPFKKYSSINGILENSLKSKTLLDSIKIRCHREGVDLELFKL